MTEERGFPVVRTLNWAGCFACFDHVSLVKSLWSLLDKFEGYRCNSIAKNKPPLLRKVQIS